MSSSLLSTPSKNRLPCRSQAGNLEYQAQQIKQDLESDIKQTERCEIDNLLQYFLYLVLDEDEQIKHTLDELQEEIETLQYARYYPDTDTSASEIETENDIHLSAASEEEVTKTQERQEILGGLLEAALNTVLGIANRPVIIGHLKDYCNIDERSFNEQMRYAPYVQLCHTSLQPLKSLPALPPFRAPSDLDLCFLRSDPMPIKSNYQGSDTAIERKPDVGATSRVAAADILGKDPTDPNFAISCTSKPKRAFTWEQLLMPVEFKLRHSRLADLFSDIFNNRNPFKVTARQSVDPDSEKWLDMCESLSSSDTLRKRKVSEEGSAQSSSKSSKRVRVSVAESLRKHDIAESSSNATRSPSGTPAAPEFVENPSIKSVSARVQCASYGLEMLSHNLGVHHAISLLIIDDILWIWYFDRQGIVQSTGMSIVRDLPRFLVLLFALQRFTLDDWGIIRELNPSAINAHDDDHYMPPPPPPPAPSPHPPKRRQSKRSLAKKKAPYKRDKTKERTTRQTTIKVNIDELAKCYKHPKHAKCLKSCDLSLKKFLSHQPHCLAGRATAVVDATGQMADGTKLDMVCKFYHPEVQRPHEGKIVEIIRDIAETENQEMAKHMPMIYFHADIPGYTTNRIRSMVGLSWKGHRVPRLIGMKKLQEITTLHTGEAFVGAWFDVVSCHTFLWQNHVEHGDPSINNMMYDPEYKCGVLTDFDLALLQWQRRIIGTDRTGTIPFMAIELLHSNYWTGSIKRHHHHELESFFWVVPYIFLLYQDGIRQSNTFIDPWRTSDYEACRRFKKDFIDLIREAATTIQKNYEDWATFMIRLCKWIRDTIYHRTLRSEDLPHPNLPSHRADSEHMWELFIGALESIIKDEPYRKFADSLSRLKSFRPDYQDLTEEKKTILMRKFAPIIEL